MSKKPEPDFTLAEVVKGEIALCLREGEILHVIKEHMTPNEAVQMLKDVMTGKITADELSKYEWRDVDMRDIPFKGTARIELPPVEKWPKK